MTSHNKQVDSNSKLTMSANGLAILIHHEGLAKSYYNDPANNCSYGVGTLVHFGPCTASELHTKVPQKKIMASLNSSLQDAERAIKTHVTHTHLTQTQFDALTSFVYNRGPGASRLELKLIDEGKFKAAARAMKEVIYGTVKDKKTGKMIKKILPGLITRREYESRPFWTVK